ncbi:lysoplasmalogenase TMEM86A-like [Symsagittifera roscoffensis]|uniref:lysoplasmalogenase TMEM86A-like n=1 Tax=Symsagittifera roscoffensis TaxID=84072 RepID=UPI00307CA213
MLQLFVGLCGLYFAFPFVCNQTDLELIVTRRATDWIFILLKVLPCVFLTFWVKSHSADLCKKTKGIFEKEEQEKIRLNASAFCLSSFGDLCLAFKNTLSFPLGILGFSLAQICYVRSFGWQNVTRHLGMSLYFIAFINLAVIFGFHLTKEDSMQGLELYVTSFAVLIYCLLIYTAFWRSLDIKIHSTDTENSSTDTLRCVGVGLFIISDTIIAVNKFCVTIPYAWIAIMGYYYLAQGLIAYSETNSFKNPRKEKII